MTAPPSWVGRGTFPSIWQGESGGKEKDQESGCPNGVIGQRAQQGRACFALLSVCTMHLNILLQAPGYQKQMELFALR